MSLLIVAMAASGTTLLFKNDLLRLTLGAAKVLPTQDTQQLGEIANKAQARFGERLRSVRFASSELPVHEVILADGGAYLDDGGQTILAWEGSRPLDLLVKFHHNLFLGETGRTMLGLLAAALAMMIVTGLVLWWPARRKWRVRPWPSDARRKTLIAVHRDLGALLTPILLVTAVTGVAVSWPTLTQPIFGFSRKSAAVVGRISDPTDWRRGFEAAKIAVPGAAIRVLTLRSDGKLDMVRLRQSGDWNSQGLSFVWFGGSGRVAKVANTRLESTSARTYSKIFPVHSGQTPQPLFRILLASAGLGLIMIATLGAATFARALGKRT